MIALLIYEYIYYLFLSLQKLVYVNYLRWSIKARNNMPVDIFGLPIPIYLLSFFLLFAPCSSY